MQHASPTGVDGTQTLAEYVTFIGDRWTRGIDPTSTYDPYSAGLRLRVVSTLGHIPVAMITAGLVDRAIDQWETEFGRSTIKNTVSALVLVLNEAVRDGIICSQPGNGSSPSPYGWPLFPQLGTDTPRDLALPNVAIPAYGTPP